MTTPVAKARSQDPCEVPPKAPPRRSGPLVPKGRVPLRRSARFQARRQSADSASFSPSSPPALSRKRKVDKLDNPAKRNPPRAKRAPRQTLQEHSGSDHAESDSSPAGGTPHREDLAMSVEREAQKQHLRTVEDPLEHTPDEPPRKGRRTFLRQSTTVETTTRQEVESGDTEDWQDDLRDRIDLWTKTGYWPKKDFEQAEQAEQDDYTEEDFEKETGEDLEKDSETDSWRKEMERRDPTVKLLFTKKKAPASPGRERSGSDNSAAPSRDMIPASNMTTPSDQKPREEKSISYRDTRYVLVLKAKGVFMRESSLDVTAASRRFYRRLLDGEQAIPDQSLFDEAVFQTTCRRLEGKNEARVIQDISRLVVPSAETHALCNNTDLEHTYIIESVDEGWNNSIPLVGIRPQPHYSVGFRREAFTDTQLKKLAPFVGDWLSGDLSLFMATYYMYFPFLACEVDCGPAGLDIADRRNAHSMAVAARAVVELFRLVEREDELHRQILCFSVSHDHRSARIYGHYPVIDGKETRYYRHPIHEFGFTVLGGRERWTAYRFTKNLYDLWMPTHFKRICEAIDQLPANLDFDVEPLS